MIKIVVKVFKLTISYKIKLISVQDSLQLHYHILLIISQKEFIRLIAKIATGFLEYESVNNNLIKRKCLSCNKDYSNKIDEKLKEIFKNTFKFSNNDINEFILLLRKGVYPYDYIDDWEKFNETSLPEKEEFYSNLNMEDITEADYMHERKKKKEFI